MVSCVVRQHCVLFLRHGAMTSTVCSRCGTAEKKTLDCDRVHRDAAQKDRISQSVGRNQRWRSHTGEKTWVHCARLRSQDNFPRDVRAIHESPSSRTRGTTRGQHMQAMSPAPDPLMSLSQQVQWINSVTLQPMEAAKWINSVTLQQLEAAVTTARVSRTKQEEVTRLQCRVLDEAIRSALRAALRATGARHMVGPAPPNHHEQISARPLVSSFGVYSVLGRGDNPIVGTQHSGTCFSVGPPPTHRQSVSDDRVELALPVVPFLPVSVTHDDQFGDTNNGDQAALLPIPVLPLCVLTVLDPHVYLCLHPARPHWWRSQVTEVCPGPLALCCPHLVSPMSLANDDGVTHSSVSAKRRSARPPVSHVDRVSARGSNSSVCPPVSLDGVSSVSGRGDCPDAAFARPLVSFAHTRPHADAQMRLEERATVVASQRPQRPQHAGASFSAGPPAHRQFAPDGPGKVAPPVVPLFLALCLQCCRQAR